MPSITHFATRPFSKTYTLLSESDNAGTGLSEIELEPLWIKFLAVPGLVLTTTASILLTVGLNRQWYLPGLEPELAGNIRIVVSIIVYFLTGILSAIHAFALCSAINFHSRLQLNRRPVALDTLGLWATLSSTSLGFSLPMKAFLYTLIFWALLKVPATLWTGALTPVTQIALQTDSSSTIQIAVYSNQSHSLWKRRALIINEDTNKTQLPSGIFTYCAPKDRFGFLLNDGASASTQDGSPSLHKKNDNSNFTYSGRSYGVGASVGLSLGPLYDPWNINKYNYTENGYMSAVNCAYNSSLSFGLSKNFTSLGDPTIYDPVRTNVYWAAGFAPWKSQGPPTDPVFPVIGGGNSDTVAAIASWTNAPNTTSPAGYYSITAGRIYRNLNATQCQVSMVPASFNIGVDMTQNLVNVSLRSTDTVEDIEPTGNLTNTAISAGAQMSEVGLSLHTSFIGQMLNDNVFNVQQQNTSETTEAKTLRAIAETLQVIIDDTLLSTASAQLMIAKDYAATPVSMYVTRLVVGSAPYIYGVLALNIIIVLIFTVEAVRTKAWQGLPKFNYTDIKSLVIGSSMGGTAVGEKVISRHTMAQTHWSGDTRDKIAGDVSVVLGRRRGLALVSSNTNTRSTLMAVGMTTCDSGA
ncbi:hypothetical protein MMC34_005431 [Xylographa carneopallida]|nr:hypothetical protein [Xylographa carneopallida]